MNQLLILLIVGAVFVDAKEEPFSIGLGVLSPSYTQTVGKENVKVQFDQKENGGFSYSVGDPGSGTNTYLSFGGAPAAPQAAPTGYAAAPAPSNNGAAGYGAPAQSYNGGHGYAAPPPAYNGAAGYAAPAHNAQPAFLNAAPQNNGFYNHGGHQAAARKPEEGMGDILPAGFSYHATDGQAFLGSMGESPTFMVEDSGESARGPAEQSFYHNAGGQRGLVNGLVGFGHGGPSGALPIGGYAGPQFQGAHREHGGHN